MPAHKRPARRGLRTAAVLACLLLVGVPAAANTITAATPPAFAAAVTAFGSVASGTPHHTPPTGVYRATSDALPGPLAGFPTEGPTFGILSSGNALWADDPNTVGWTSASNAGGSGGHGPAVFDLVSTTVDVPGALALYNCVSFDFRFLTEEYPEWVGSRYNDAFLAIVNGDAWTESGSVITAPRNFARDEFGNLISVNSAGAVSVTAAKAAGTTYDGATSKLRASTVVAFQPVHQLHLSIFDVGDSIYDSTVFVDRVRVEPYDFSSPRCRTGLRGIDLPTTGTIGQPVLPPWGGNDLTVEVTQGDDVQTPVAGALVKVLLSKVLQEETDAAEPLVDCPLWSTQATTDGSGFAYVGIPPADVLGGCGDPLGKYLVTVDVEHAANAELTLYGSTTTGYEVQ